MNDHRHFKNQLYDQFTRIGKAIANPHRLELLDLLAQGERSVDDLAREAALPIANTSQHLQALRRAQLVDVRRDGPFSMYRLANDRVYQLFQTLRELAEAQFADIDRLISSYLADRTALEAIDAPTLLRRIQHDDVVVLDVRPESEYRAGHIPGARSIPVNDLAGRLGELPPGKDVVAYCRGPYCLFSDEAVTVLRAHGIPAARLTTGLPDWRLAGYPVVAEYG